MSVTQLLGKWTCVFYFVIGVIRIVNGLCVFFQVFTKLAFSFSHVLFFYISGIQSYTSH